LVLEPEPELGGIEQPIDDIEAAMDAIVDELGRALCAEVARGI